MGPSLSAKRIGIGVSVWNNLASFSGGWIFNHYSVSIYDIQVFPVFLCYKVCNLIKSVGQTIVHLFDHSISMLGYCQGRFDMFFIIKQILVTNLWP